MYLILNSVRFVGVSLTCFMFVRFPEVVLSNNLTLKSNDGSIEAVVNDECSNQFNLYHHCLNDDRCLSYMQLPNGNINVTIIDNIKTLHFSCLPGYHYIGPPKLICQEWDDILQKPTCVKGCSEPPMVINGEVFINGHKEENKLFSDGVVAEYACAAGYRLTPITSQHRICQQGEWTGSPVTCVFEGCPRLKGILHGRIEREGSIDKILLKEVTQDIIMDSSIKEGVILHYKCDNGFNLIGPSYAKCQATGTWQPHVLPSCKRPKFGTNRTISSSMDYYPPVKTLSTQDYFPGDDSSTDIESSCSFGPHIRILAIQSRTGNNFGETANMFTDGTVIEATCAFGYRDKQLNCVPQILRCDKGIWQGHSPSCVKAEDCLFPSKIAHGELESVTGGVGGGHFGVGGQVTYTCLPGYQLAGEPTLTCQGGCWQPNVIPVCEPQFYLSASWPEYLNMNTSLLFSVVTALSVLFVLLSVCLAVVFRHRPTPLHHHHSTVPPAPPALVPPPPDPDRVALIAFADGIQSGLPSYEEAVRGGSLGGRGSLLSYRLHHPPWSQRRNPRPDTTVVTRQLSSTGESMGSTDTMTVSDVSTNLTLDTVSSHTCSSTSQTASCRAICGSLASFDTSSVLNTEGVPLLEENELEESGANIDLDDNSLAPACDNTSFKLQSDIDSIHS